MAEKELQMSYQKDSTTAIVRSIFKQFAPVRIRVQEQR